MYKCSRFVVRRELKRSQVIRTCVVTTTRMNNIQIPIKPWNKIPGPFSLPIIGQILNFLPGGWLYKRTTEVQKLLYENYGPIVRLDGNKGFPAITFIYDMEAALNLFRKEDVLPHRPGFYSLNYHRKKFYNNDIHDPSGLILENGESWRKLRSSVNPVMLHLKTIKQYSNIMTEIADDMIKRLRLIRNKQNMLESNVYMEINLWALESVGVVALGDRLNCFDPNLPEDSPTKKLIKKIHHVILSLEKLDYQPSLWRYFATPDFVKGMKVYNDYMNIHDFFIDKAEQKLRTEEKTNNKDNSVLEKLLQIDRKVAAVVANDMFLGGIDTTSSTVMGLLYLLAVNPEKQMKLRNEIMLKQDKQPYLKACIKETMRLLPSVNGNFRRTTKEHDILGYKIPKGMIVISGNQTVCLMEEQFKRATEFIPERWIVNKSDPLYYGNAHPFAYSPFGFGSRSCIGRRIADLEMETFVAKFVENFQIEWSGPSPKRIRRAVVNFFDEPYNFIFKDI